MNITRKVVAGVLAIAVVLPLVTAALIFLIGPAVYNGITVSWLRFGSGSLGSIPYGETLRLAMLTGAGGAVRTIANGFLITGTVAGLAGLALVAWGSWSSVRGRLSGATADATADTAATAVKR